MPALPTLSLAPFLLAIGLPSAFAQEGMQPSARQRKSLEPMIESVTWRCAIYVPSLDEARVKRAVKKALSNQVSRVAAQNLEEMLVELMAEDLGIGSKDGRSLVRRNLLPDFSRDITADEWALVDPGGEEPLDSRPYELDVRGIESVHRRVVRHDRSAIGGYEDELADGEPSKDQRRAAKALAEYYAGPFCELFGDGSGGRKFAKHLEPSLATVDTERALLASLLKLRVVVRPQVEKVFEVESDADRIDAETRVRERIVKELGRGELWAQLREDHAALVTNPKRLRDTLAERKKAAKKD